MVRTSNISITYTPVAIVRHSKLHQLSFYKIGITGPSVIISEFIHCFGLRRRIVIHVVII